MFEIFRIIIALFGSAFAGLWDLKTSDIPDSVCIAMIVAGLAFHTAQGFLTGDFSLLISSLMFGGLFLVFGLLMYFTGQWGGGDGELLVSIGVLLPTTGLAPTALPFSLSFFLNMLMIGALYSIVYALYISFRNKKTLVRFIRDFRRDRITQAVMILLVALIIASIYLNFIFMISFLLLLMLILTFFYKFAKMIEKDFYVRIPTSKLKEGDVIGEDIPKLNLYKKHIRGLTEKEVSLIRKMKRYVMVRSGVRFGPVFSITLVITLIFGDLLLALF